ncbi:hypothetical protein BS50DRAFT_8355 [Corynespora cassiicola Philippines]|uniref:Uncharacterized protein n=1 Tax=Corynespora cassiicola Philippines TaxID=1448308 RepID=A0A2T2P9T3_CORCC|nr:hypothetical protein BS50DRAFT_8355 [Corynespora cassiicola Philippines]
MYHTTPDYSLQRWTWNREATRYITAIQPCRPCKPRALDNPIRIPDPCPSASFRLQPVVPASMCASCTSNMHTAHRARAAALQKCLRRFRSPSEPCVPCNALCYRQSLRLVSRRSSPLAHGLGPPRFGGILTCQLVSGGIRLRFTTARSTARSRSSGRRFA